MRIKMYYYFNQEICNLLSKIYKNKTSKLFKTLSTPTPIYTIRINTLKTDAYSVINHLKSYNYKFYKFIIKSEIIPEIIYYKVKSKRRKIKIHDKKIFVDKYTAESVSQGANLYRPGIKKIDKFRKDDILTVLTKINGIEIPVANIRAVKDSNEIMPLTHGLVGINIKSIYSGISIRDLDIYKKGYVYDQSLPAILTSRILNPKPDEFIIDMCASPGGKTTHIAQLMNNKGTILAIDRTKRKIKRLKENLERLGIKNVRLEVMDSTKLEGYDADRILIDPPCSALGVRPKLVDFTTLKDIKNFSKYQRAFIDSAVKNLRQGGILVYSTCTLTIEENEMNINYLIKKYNFKIIDQPFFIGINGIPIDNNNSLIKTQRFCPIINKTPGYFIAKLKKI